MTDLSTACEWSRCPVFVVCPHVDANNTPPVGTKCELVASYLDTVSSFMTAVFKDYATSMMMHRIRTELMPLYYQLCKFKIIEYGVRLHKEAFHVQRNVIAPHPVYKEIRDILSDIGRFWENSGLMMMPGYLPNMDIRMYIEINKAGKPQVDINVGHMLHEKKVKTDAVVDDVVDMIRDLDDDGVDKAYNRLPEETKEDHPVLSLLPKVLEEEYENRVKEHNDRCRRARIRNDKIKEETKEDCDPMEFGDPTLHERLMGEGGKGSGKKRKRQN